MRLQSATHPSEKSHDIDKMGVTVTCVALTYGKFFQELVGNEEVEARVNGEIKSLVIGRQHK